VTTAMTVAGSDSGSGAGIQADLKTFAAFGVYGTSAITAITAQNTLGVTGIVELSTDIIAKQIDAIVSDIGADAVKTGMLSSAPVIELVASKVEEHGLSTLVVDPVMIAKGGDPLLQESAVTTLRDRLVPLALVITPNIPEAEVLTGMKIESESDMRAAARAIHAMGARNVVVKGGHAEGPATDILYDMVEISRHSPANGSLPETRMERVARSRRQLRPASQKARTFRRLSGPRRRISAKRSGRRMTSVMGTAPCIISGNCGESSQL
jgi:hydroxymethylpyrimidine/phosphomethylpyrimidine kinase